MVDTSEPHQSLVAASDRICRRSFALAFLDMADPRGGRGELIAFYFPGHATEWDAFCGSGFLGNFYQLSDVLEVELGGGRFRFQNAEAAFQALKFKAWVIVESLLVQLSRRHQSLQCCRSTPTALPNWMEMQRSS